MILCYNLFFAVLTYYWQHIWSFWPVSVIEYQVDFYLKPLLKEFKFTIISLCAGGNAIGLL